MNAPAARSRQDVALARYQTACKLREENPNITLEEIGAACGGISKQRVSQLFKHPPQERWPEDLLTAMCEALADGKPPQDLLALPGVAERISAKRPRGRLKADADAEAHKRRLSSLRKLISIGQDAPEGTPSRRLYDARQAGLDKAARDWPEPVFQATEAALRSGSKYAEVLVEVPALGEYLGDSEARQAIMLRVIVESGEERPAGTRGRRLFDARQAGARE